MWGKIFMQNVLNLDYYFIYFGYYLQNFYSKLCCILSILASVMRVIKDRLGVFTTIEV